jgi:NADPH:quinone reductase
MAAEGRHVMSVAESAQPTPPTAPAVVRERPGGETMRAIVLEKFGGLDSLIYTDIPKPLPQDGEVVIKVRGFGINHARLHMRRGEWAEAAGCAHGRPRSNHQRQLR